jgi:GNAT superfamily N-acetyltransferase
VRDADSQTPALTVEAVTTDRLPDVATLFGTNSTANGCYCTWFLVPTKENQAGWSGANRTTFEEAARAATAPMGLLAYADGVPVGWCATGPRSRYSRALRTAALRQRDATEDEGVWLVPCFFVKVGFRRQGIMRALLQHAIELAARHGARAVESFPLRGDERKRTGDAFVGVEPLFASSGFRVVSRPSTSRVLMRLDLTGGASITGHNGQSGGNARARRSGR